jgi:CDP-diacylglycerol--glycerol-3-phosphate 3-phosphatidyltransferase
MPLARSAGKPLKRFPIVKHLPNIITLSRVPILFVIAGLIELAVPAATNAQSARWCATIGFVLYVLAAISDWLDGWLARKLGIVSTFGKLMDALTDKILNTGMFIVLLAFGVFPRWYVFLILVVLVRELLVTGLRLVAAGKGIILAAERSGKIKTLLQFISISILLGTLAAKTDGWPLPDVVIHAFDFGGAACFHVAAVLTVTSGAGYLIKYWDVFMGDPETPGKA